MTDETIENNYLEAAAQKVANWLARPRVLTGFQRAILAELGRRIDEALEDDVIENAQAPR